MDPLISRAAAVLLTAAGAPACSAPPGVDATGAPAALRAAESRDAADAFPATAPLGLDAYLPVPADNPLTRAKVELGRRLFVDPILSRDRTLACASCHRPERAFSDSLPISPGVDGRLVARNAPALVNRAWGESFFWDGRAGSLEEAVLLPIENPRELALPLDSALERLRAEPRYRRLFRAAFGGDVATRANLARALASYLRTLRFGDAPADRFAAGDTTALSPAARRGRRIFLGRGNCGACHAGPNLTDERFHNTGIGWPADPGRFAVTGEPADSGRFKTPTLREVGRTAPYMHDGSVPGLDSVVAFYAAGGGTNPYLDDEIRTLELSAGERRDLVAFLEALTSCAGRQC